MCEIVYQAATKTAQAVADKPMSFETAITIMLTALAVILAALAIMIGIVAVFGYTGLRDSLREMAIKQVSEAMETRLKTYPEAAQMHNLLQRLQQKADFYDQVQNQIVTPPEPNTIAVASNNAVQDVQPAIAPVIDPAAAMPTYPGEEVKSNVSTEPKPNTTETPAAPRADNSEVPGDGTS